MVASVWLVKISSSYALPFKPHAGALVFHRSTNRLSHTSTVPVAADGIRSLQ